MIITYTYQVPLHDHDGDTKVDLLRLTVHKMLPKHPHLRGLQASHADGMLIYKLRMAHVERSRIQRLVKKLAAQLVLHIGLDWREAREVDQIRENVYYGQPARPGKLMWEGLPWWGDQLDGYATESD